MTIKEVLFLFPSVKNLVCSVSLVMASQAAVTWIITQRSSPGALRDHQ